ncbi:MAG TPA: CrcB family protein [Xanthobacteraceae bacterium]|nr:CrcB family protein [Xanthobacteraceae bacterium]
MDPFGAHLKVAQSKRQKKSKCIAALQIFTFHAAHTTRNLPRPLASAGEIFSQWLLGIANLGSSLGLYQKKKAKHCGPTERARRVAPLGTDLFSQSLWLSSHSGGCLIGFFELFLAHSKIPLEAALFVITGFLGARTTFSTFGALP